LTSDDRIIVTPVDQEMRGSYLEYAMSVIRSRAIPDVRDGLKPVQRRILYGMHEMGLRPGTPYKKCARIVGEVMGKYHPHGDTAIYDALVHLAQDFSMRLPTIDGHGNFGSLGGEDPPAAMRYTECKLGPAAMPMVEELGENTVDFIPNYDGTETQPEVLPAAFPNLLVNGTAGIAVGMATKMAPHNLVEVVHGLRAMLADDAITVEQLMQHIPGPDMPTGAIIIGADGIREAYETGRGKFRVRANAKITDVVSRRSTTGAKRKGIVVTELPDGIGPEKVIESIKEQQKVQKLLGVGGVVDLSDHKAGLMLVIEIKTGFNPQAVLEELFRFTPLEQSFAVNAVCIVNNQPQTLGLLAVCRHYLNHRISVVTRRTRDRLKRAEARMHIVEGLLVALQAIDEVVSTIKASKDTDTARKALIKAFKLSDIQAGYILEMPLRRLTSLEVTKLKDEHTELARQIAEFKALLASPQAIRDLVGDELLTVANKYGTPRRSVLVAVAPDPGAAAVSLEIPDDPCLVTVSASGLISRAEAVDGKVPAFRGKHGRHDALVAALATTNRATIGAVTDQGRLLRVPVIELPKIEGRNRGAAVSEFVADLSSGETVVALVALPDPKSEQAKTTGFAVGTVNGLVKRITADAFPVKSGQEIIGLKDGDKIAGLAPVVSDDADLLFVTSAGQLLRAPASSVRPQGRTGGGVAGVKLVDATVVAFTVIEPGAAGTAVVATVTNAGSAKVSKLQDYPVKGRGGAGMRCHTFRKDEDRLVAAYAGTATALAVVAGADPQPLPAEFARRDSSGTVSFDGEVTGIGIARF
jgi:DNA gyrase subunit A